MKKPFHLSKDPIHGGDTNPPTVNEADLSRAKARLSKKPRKSFAGDFA